jgi:ferritin-like metal-binding protein YciE
MKIKTKNKSDMKTNSSTRVSKSEAKTQTKGDTSSELQELFVNELKDIYWAEKALVKAIPKMIKNATEQELIDALEQHLSATEEQVKRVEEVFESIGIKAEAKKCEAMAGLIKEADEIMSETRKGIVRDAGIISAAQKVEHYEIASYGTLCAFAKTLGKDEAADLLQETLDEEKEADATLTEIAESSVNQEATEQEE